MYYIRRYGRTPTALATLQEGMRYVEVAQVGFVAYKTVGRLRPTHFVLGDPICNPPDTEQLIDATLRRLRNVVFVQVHRRIAALLQRRGYYRNELGTEISLELDTWNTSGRQRDPIRRAINRAARRGVVIKEVESRSFRQRDDVRQIAREWLQRKSSRASELAFLVMPARCIPTGETRTFAAWVGTTLVAVAHFTPLYAAGRIEGYQSEMIHTSNGAPSGLAHAIRANAAGIFRQEGLKTLHLGLAPGLNVLDLHGGNSPMLTVMFNALFQLGNAMYGFKGLARSKRWYGGNDVPVYYCTRRRLPLLELYRLIRACHIAPLRELWAGRRNCSSTELS